MSRAPYLGKDCGKNLNVLRDWGRVMDPIQFHARLPNHGHQVKLRICLAKTVMWSSSKDEPILDLLFRITGDPPLRIKGIWVRICFWIVCCWPYRWDNHGTLLDGV